MDGQNCLPDLKEYPDLDVSHCEYLSILACLLCRGAFQFDLVFAEQAPRVDKPPKSFLLRHPSLSACHSGAALAVLVKGRGSVGTGTGQWYYSCHEAQAPAHP